jgi:hypothetical protein
MDVLISSIPVIPLIKTGRNSVVVNTRSRRGVTHYASMHRAATVMLCFNLRHSGSNESRIIRSFAAQDDVLKHDLQKINLRFCFVFNSPLVARNSLLFLM